MAKPIYTNDQIINQIANVRMYSGNFSYIFDSSEVGLAFNEMQKAAAREAFKLWDDLIPISITEATASDTPGLYLKNTNSTGFSGAYYNGAIVVSNQYDYNVAPQNGNYGMLTLVHEIGHALGLDHPGPYNGSANYANDAVYYQDTHQYTIMSYFSASNTGANHGSYYPSTPMLHDILAIQSLYGIDTTTRTGDTVYGFNSNADRSAYVFSAALPPIVCIWDAGGQDTLDVSGYAMNQKIDLRQGAFSDIGGLTYNVSISYGADIENATAGAGADLVQGNNLNNILNGGAGNDTLMGFGGTNTLNGGDGTDTVDYSWSTTAVTANISISTGVTTGVSTDKYISIENLTGSSFNDTLTGTAGNNVIRGGAGMDNINGGLGADTLYGDAGADTISYDVNDVLVDGGSDLDTIRLTDTQTVNLANAADQVVGGGIATGFENVTASGSGAAVNITGDAANNTLTGGNGLDTILGAGGNDMITGSSNDTRLDGGTGIDTLILTSAININLANATDQSVGGGVVTGFENVNASALTTAVSLTGDSLDNIFITGKSLDTIQGGAGNDVITADFSDTLVNGDAGEDTLKMVSGFSVNLSNATDHTSGGGVVTGFENIDATGCTATVTLTGSASANKITGGNPADTLLGQAGNDIIAGNSTDTLLDGGADTDTLKLTAAMNINLANASDQSVGGGIATNFENIDASSIASALTLTGSSIANTIYGGSSSDTINGGTGADSLYGNAGNDSLYYDATDSIVDGGANSDTLFLTAAATVNLANSADQVSGGGIAKGFENVSAWGISAAVNITGDATANILTGGNGADTLQGNDGDDIIAGNASDVLLTGGSGTDTLRLTANANVDLSNAADQLIGSATATSFENIDANTSYVTAGLILSGDASINTIQGGNGADTINGNGGADILRGNGGNDILFFDFNSGLNADGGAGIDTLKVANPNYVTINLSNTANHIVGTGTATNFENVDASAALGGLTLTGSSVNNQLMGGAGWDYIDGGAGSDIIYGNSGDDTFVYDASDSLLDGGDGSDSLWVSTGITANLSNTNDQVSGGGSEKNFENIYVSGTQTSANLTGSAVANTLQGDMGNDILSGLGGSDYLRGGMGADRFVFTKATAFDGVDTVQDFNTSNYDIIDIADLLAGYIIDSLNIDQYVSITRASGFGMPSYSLQVDIDGTGGAYNFQTIASLVSFETLNAGLLYNNGLLDVIA